MPSISQRNQSGRAVTRHTWQRAPQGRGLVLGESDPALGAGITRNTETLDEFPAQLPDHEADLLDIATAVFGTDRLAPRPPSDAQYSDAHLLDWQRELHVTIPVRDATYWRADSPRVSIERVLAELTGDMWFLTFVESAPSSTTRWKQMRLLQPTDCRPVALFSGGLDSLAGTLLYARENRRVPWLVCIASNSHVRNQQGKLLMALQEHLQVVPDKLLFRAHNAGIASRDLAKRQRARSFLYFLVAALVAHRIGSNEVLVLENGVTSLNVPISPILTSTRVTRTTHPLVLMAFEEMIHVTLRWPAFRIRSPHAYSTKAEMVSAVSDASELIAATSSCARDRTGEWCGTCTACILRRQVLWAAGLTSLDRKECDTRYKYDILKSFAGKDVDPERRWYFLATLDHIGRLLRDRDALAGEPSLPLVARSVAARTGSSPASEMRKIIDLHERYAKEWVRVLERAKSDYPALSPIAAALTARKEVSV